MTLEDEIANQMAVQMRNEIDFQVLADMLVELGWRRVFINYAPPERSWIVVKQWAEDNCRGSHEEHNGIWLFENEQDANWFALRWL